MFDLIESKEKFCEREKGDDKYSYYYVSLKIHLISANIVDNFIDIHL